MTVPRTSVKGILDRFRTRAVPGRVAPGHATITADAVSVRRGGREVVSAVSLAVRAGEVLALVGPNGAGKSTLLAALAGEIPEAAGAVRVAWVDDAPPDDRTTPQHRTLDTVAAPGLALLRAVLPQSHVVSFPFTAREVVRMGRAAWARTPEAAHDDRVVDDALHTVDATHLAERPFPALSGGERARVALARVLAQQTQTLMLDEPTAALDFGHQETVMRVVRARADAGAAVVVVLHDLTLAAAYADRVAVLADGRLVADGAPGDVLTEDLLTDVYRYPVTVRDDPDSGRPIVQPRRDHAPRPQHI